MQTNVKDLSIKQEYGASCRRIFWPMLAVFYSLFVIRNIFLVNFPVSFYLIWVAAMAVTFDDTEIKALLIAFVPLASGFQSKYAVLICMVILLIRHCKQIKVPFFALIIPVLMLWELFHLDDRFSSMGEYLSGFAPLMCLVIVVSLPYKSEDTVFFSRVLAFSLVVGGLIMIYNTISRRDQSLLTLIQEGFRFGTVEDSEGHHITYNENGLGFFCNLAIAGLLTNICVGRARKIDYFFICFSVLLGCMTVSRTFLLCLAGTFVLYILFQKRTLGKKIGVFLSFVVICLVSIVILKVISPGIIENYIERFNAEDVTGGRAFLNDFYNEFITSSPKRFFYGIGVQCISEKILYSEGIVVNVPHNGYQQLVVAWGVVGLCLMLLFIIGLVLAAKRKNPHAPLMCYLPLVLLMINILAGQFITVGSKLMSLVFIYLMICNGGKGVVEDNTK